MKRTKARKKTVKSASAKPASKAVAKKAVGKKAEGKKAVGKKTKKTGVKKSRPKRKVLADRKRRFHGILVAEIVRLFGDAKFRIAPLELKTAGRGSNEPGHEPQQGGFPRAIATGDGQGFPGADRKADAREDIPAAAVTGQFGSGQAHRPIPGPPDRSGF